MAGATLCEEAGEMSMWSSIIRTSGACGYAPLSLEPKHVSLAHMMPFLTPAHQWSPLHALTRWELGPLLCPSVRHDRLHSPLLLGPLT